MSAKSVSVQVTTTASAQAVWDVITDVDSAPRRLDGVIAVERLSGDTGFQVGTKWRETRKMMGKEASEVMWVTELSAGSSYVVEAESRGMHYRSTYRVTAKSDHTVVDLEFTGEQVGSNPLKNAVMHLMYAVMAGTTRKMLRKDLEALLSAAEQGGS